MQKDSIAADAHLADDTGPPARRSPWTRVILIGLLLVVVAGTAVMLRARSAKAKADAAAQAKQAADRAIPVLTSQAERRDVSIWREGLGNVAAFYTVTVKTQVDGRIDKVLFNEGQHVKKGDVLFQIDPRPFQIQLLSAQAALERDQSTLKNAQLNLDRYKTLSTQNLIPQQQYTDQIATVAQSDGAVKADEASIDSAKLNLDYARIISPIDGVVGIRMVDPGNVVHAADTTGLVVVTQLDPIAVFFTLPEDDLPAITKAQAGGTITLTVDAYGRDGETQLGVGTLQVIDNQINQATATLRLKAIFPNPQYQLWPNQFVKTRLHLTTRANSTVIPASAVQHGPQGTFVYVANADATADARPVTIALTQAEIAIVSKGLNPGEQVVVEGQAQLRPHAKIAPKPAPAGLASGKSASSAGGHGSPSSSDSNSGPGAAP
jgi:multidrug efflux system membrane fusion protein